MRPVARSPLAGRFARARTQGIRVAVGIGLVVPRLVREGCGAMTMFLSITLTILEAPKFSWKKPENS